MFAGHNGLLIGLLLSSSVCLGDGARPVVQGSGQGLVEERPLYGFTRVESKLPVLVRISHGETFQVRVTADDNVAPVIRARVEGDVLVLDAAGPFVAASPTHLDIVLPALRGVVQRGSGTVEVWGITATGALQLSQSGSGNLSFEGAAQTLDVESLGSGGAIVRGTTQRLQAALTGSGFIDAADLRVTAGATLAMRGSGSLRAKVTGDTVVTNNGSGEIDVAVNGGTASFGVNGSGTIRWSGDARVAASTVNGSGEIERG